MNRFTLFKSVNRIIGRQQGLLTVVGGFRFLSLLSVILAPWFYRIMIDEVLIGGDLSRLKVVLIGMAALYLYDSLVGGAALRLSNRLYNRLLYRLRFRLIHLYLTRPPGFYDTHPAGELKMRIDEDSGVFEKFIRSHILDYLYNLIVLLAFGCVMLYLHPLLALFGFVMVPFSFLFTRFLKKRAARIAESFRSLEGDYEEWLRESLHGWREVKSLGLESHSLMRFCAYWKGMIPLFFKRQVFWWANRSFISLKDFFITRMNLYFIGGLLIINGSFTVGALLIFMKYYEQFFSAIGVITDFNLQYATDRANLNRVISLLREPRESVAASPFHNRDLKISDLSFAYYEQRSVIDGLSFTLSKGSWARITGKSGRGKTTLIKLLLKHYEGYRGKIQLGEWEYGQLSPTNVYKLINTVAQDSRLFNLSVRENLLIANPKAGEERLWEACRLTCIDEFVNGLPQGMDTLIGERGIKLSGGQRQRIVIARALLRESDLVIFDEATSALDGDTENRLFANIFPWLRGKNFLYVAHRDIPVLFDSGESINIIKL